VFVSVVATLATDVSYESIKNISDRVLTACESAGSIPHEVDLIGNVTCENGFEVNYNEFYENSKEK